MPPSASQSGVQRADTLAPATLPPPLKWAGGKRWLVPKLQALWQPYRHGRLVEPFCGGLAVALGLAPKVALLNDQNDLLINFYQQLKAGLTVEIDCQNTAESYYLYRQQFNQELKRSGRDLQLLAALFYYLNRTGYNGLCRFNSKGEFNVPFGRYKSITYRYQFEEYPTVLAGWTFRQGDFRKLAIAAGDFVYADPPYDVEFTQYAQQDFKWDDQVRLAQWLAQLTVPVVASNQATERILRLYQDLGFRIETLPAPRRISCTGDRTPALEMLAFRRL
jgi:DNA adenine methylase